jgi:hypothetical protein
VLIEGSSQLMPMVTSELLMKMKLPFSDDKIREGGKERLNSTDLHAELKQQSMFKI